MEKYVQEITCNFAQIHRNGVGQNSNVTGQVEEHLPGCTRNDRQRQAIMYEDMECGWWASRDVPHAT